ncbi:glycosyltransferase [bacterium]|nr:glycosyltransferase [bacterium]
MSPNQKNKHLVTHELFHKHPEESACRTLTGRQWIILISLSVLLLVFLMVSPSRCLILANFLAVTFYILFSLYKFFLINLSIMKKKEIEVSAGEIEALPDEKLPVYTILVPLYKETELLKQITTSINKLDYPKDKLDVKLLLEEDDRETIEFTQKLSLDSHFKRVIVPHSIPKTKPKACNLGLSEAQGEFLVIYDAEDVPESDQLKKAILAFRKVPDEVICLQAKLNFYNQRQNWLTRWFTTEYSMWFDLYLPGLGDFDAPIPLGGTSNHFKTDKLKELCGWDPYNVAEDCDLGIRLHKRGYRTQMLDSTTWEEACSNLKYWIRQRSRWVKGYIQTYLVNNRHPVSLLKKLGIKNYLNFHMIVGGMFFCFLMNPFYWLLTLLWFLTRWQELAIFFPPAVFLLGALCLFVGNFVFIYTCAIGAYKRGYYDLVKYALIIPPYWALISIGAWKGFIQLITRPFYWEKTRHGFFQENKREN